MEKEWNYFITDKCLSCGHEGLDWNCCESASYYLPIGTLKFTAVIDPETTIRVRNIEA